MTGPIIFTNIERIILQELVADAITKAVNERHETPYEQRQMRLARLESQLYDISNKLK